MNGKELKSAGRSRLFELPWIKTILDVDPQKYDSPKVVSMHLQALRRALCTALTHVRLPPRSSIGVMRDSATLFGRSSFTYRAFLSRQAPRQRARRFPNCSAMQAPFVPAVVTAFDKSGKLDKDSTARYFNFLWEAGFQDIVVNGSTGEFPSMTLDEREEVAEIARASWPGKQIVNISACNIADSLRLLRHSQQSKEHLKGDRCIADGVLLLPPYYFAASTATGLERFFTSIIQEATLPVYLYNFPANTGGLVSINLFKKLTDQFPQLRGIKNTFDDMPLQKKFKAATPDRQIYVGHDPSALTALESGMDGVIAATASVLPEHLLKLAKAHQNGDQEQAKQLMDEINVWNNAVEELGVNIFAAVKAGLSHRLPGFSTAVRPPLDGATPEQAEKLGEVLKKLKLI